MGATIIVNGRTVVHKDSGGKAPSVPDFCKTPTPPGPPVPIPYVNIAQSTDTADGSKKVKMDGNPIMLKTSKFSTSKGDEAGTAKGVASSTTSGIAKFVNYSFDVKVEGKNVPRLGDPMTNNGNGPNSFASKIVQKNVIVGEVGEKVKCPECGKPVKVRKKPKYVECAVPKERGLWKLRDIDFGISVFPVRLRPLKARAWANPRRTNKLEENGFEVVQTHACELEEPGASNHWEIRAKITDKKEKLATYLNRLKKLLRSL